MAGLFVLDFKQFPSMVSIGHPKAFTMSEEIAGSKIQSRLDHLVKRLHDGSRRNPLLHLNPSRGLRLLPANGSLPDVWRALKKPEGAKSIGVPFSLDPIWEEWEYAVLNQSWKKPETDDDIELIEDHVVDDETTENAVLSKRIRINEWLNDDQSSAVLQALKKHEAHIAWDLDPDQLHEKLNDLFRESKSYLEETGIHTLYLCCGIVQWKEKDGANENSSPLFLIPAKLKRESVRDPFYLRIEGDVVFNPTLLNAWERLWGWKSNPLLTDHYEADEWSAADYEEALRSIEVKAVETGKTVAIIKNEARLSLFTFSRQQILNDIKERKLDVINSPTMERLLNPEAYEGATESASLPDWSDLDNEFGPDNLFLPLPADASQKRAIAWVDRGQSVTIEGPPGTGKSQTIANMIAHLLAKGKKVLFVAEKMTALSVVHDRLLNVGLGPFCMEMHNVNAGKQHHLSQIKEGLNLSRINDAATYEWSEVSTRLKHAYQQLNKSVDAVHESTPIGKTWHYWIGRFAQFSSEKIVEGWEESWKPESMPLNSFEVWRTELKILMQHWNAANAHQAIQEFQCPEWPEDDGKAWAAFLDQHIEALQNKEHFLWARGWGLGESLSEIRQKEAVIAFLLKEPKSPIQEWASIWGTESWYEGAEYLCEAIDHHFAVWKIWKPYFNDEKLLVLSQWKRSLEEATSANVFIRWFKIRSWEAMVQKNATQKMSHEELAAFKNDLPELIARWNKAQKMADGWAKDLHLPWSPSLWGPLLAWRSWKKEVENKYAFIGGNFSQLSQRSRSETLRSLRNALGSWKQVPWGLFPVLNDKLHRGSVDFEAYASALKTVRLNFEKAIAWKWYHQQKKTLLKLHAGMSFWINKIESGWGKKEDDIDAVEATLLFHLLKEKMAEWSPLQDYLGGARNIRLEELVKLESDYQRIASEALVSKIVKLHRSSSTKAQSGLQVIERELNKKSRWKSIRQLVEGSSEALMAIKPCWLMSPLSLANHWPANGPKFDVVIFDEASQIPIEDAIGGITRASQIVIVGDPKQMPPSRGFTASDWEDEDDDWSADIQSVLDAALLSMPKTQLNWHYRSRHEDLIAFSNERYYDGQLVTFPASEIKQGGLVWKRVPGVYGRGGSRTNPIEAKAIVDRIIEIKTQEPQKTIGVVTFNQTQQRLIQKMLDRKLQEAMIIDVDGMNSDAVFVKNLENVQGDERDVILFSATFGPDSKGIFRMSLGPLGHAGGERRLNVAITRAKERMEVFASFDPEMLDVRNAKHRGAKDFRDFLIAVKTANDREPVAIADDYTSLGKIDSPFEKSIAERLHRLGWNLHAQVGASGYRIDLAVVDPTNKGRYLAAIECDGAAYHSLKSARDRDFMRQQLLERLGWKVLRVWSTDFFQNPEGTINAIDQTLRQLRGSDE